MSEPEKTIRISTILPKLNIKLDRAIEFFASKGYKIDNNPNQKISEPMRDILIAEFQSEKSAKEEAQKVGLNKAKESAANSTTEKKIEAPVVVETPKKKEDETEVLIKNTTTVSEPKKEEKVVEATPKAEEETSSVKVVGKIDLDSKNFKTKPDKKSKAEKETEVKVEKETKTTKGGKKKKEELVEDVKPEVTEVAPIVVEPTEEKPVENPEDNFIKTNYEKLEGPTILGKMILPVKEDKKKPVGSSNPFTEKSGKKKRKRIKKGPVSAGADAAVNVGKGTSLESKDSFFAKRKDFTKKPAEVKPAATDEEISNQIKETLARLSGAGKSKASKHRRTKREEVGQQIQDNLDQQEAEKKIIKVTEFVSANELAKMMNVPVNNIISTCMSLGMFVSINQRLDAETISIVAAEFDHTVEFVSAEVQVQVAEEVDKPEDLKPRSPIVTVMGHVDHGKTSLLDYIRKANVIAGEAGGITQHIGAYSVQLDNGKKIAFLDTPGHEAFTAMRARGAQVTDIVIIVVAADDNVMPQTKEAINHAQAAGVPIVIAINKIDKPGANPDKIREELSAMNILVEEWGGKYQCQEISAKKGTNIEALLEKVLLEAELLDLKANANKNAAGTVIEASLDKGKGYVTTLLVQTGTIKVGDVVLAGCFSGRVKAIFNERGATIKEAGPSSPALILGLTGAPQAGDKFKVMDDEREAREIATKRLQLQREQGYRTQKHITLDEIGRRLAIGDFKQLNLIVKGDVDGSVEALTDSLLKLSTDKVAINVVLKSVGQVSESDVLLASASDAIIVAFNVRPSLNARKLAETEQIDIRTYSIIYNAINEIKAAMEGMLAPEFEEKIVCNIEIREVYNITKVGTIAGCMVLDGKVTRHTKVRIIRNGIVIHTGELGSLKRFKDDVKEVATGYECGLNINNFNDIQVNDIVEGYEMVEIKAKL
jgi:translation initiation factor IF-2